MITNKLSTIFRITEAIIKSYSAMDDASDSECESSEEEEGGEEEVVDGYTIPFEEAIETEMFSENSAFM